MNLSVELTVCLPVQWTDHKIIVRARVCVYCGHCHRTRFRDSFCLASVFEMTVYLLTYLLPMRVIEFLLFGFLRSFWNLKMIYTKFGAIT